MTGAIKGHNHLPYFFIRLYLEMILGRTLRIRATSEVNFDIQIRCSYHAGIRIFHLILPLYIISYVNNIFFYLNNALLKRLLVKTKQRHPNHNTQNIV